MKFKIMTLTLLVWATGIVPQDGQAHAVNHAGQSGLASWYAPRYRAARTASGERFEAAGFTAAHRTWPFGTRVLVTNRRTGRSVVVRINDRGPYVGGRVIDLSRASARAIGLGGVDQVFLARL